MRKMFIFLVSIYYVQSLSIFFVIENMKFDILSIDFCGYVIYITFVIKMEKKLNLCLFLQIEMQFLFDQNFVVIVWIQVLYFQL